MVVNHVGLCVTDLERSRRFYVEALGFEEWFSVQPSDEMSAPLLGLEPPLGLSAVYLRSGAFVLELLAFADAGTIDAATRVVNEPGLTHISLAVDDLGATLDAVRSGGGEVIDGTNIGVAVMIRDPDGQMLELLPMGYRDSLPE